MTTERRGCELVMCQVRTVEPARRFACPLGSSLIRLLLSSFCPGSPSVAMSGRQPSVDDPATDLTAESRLYTLLPEFLH